VLTHLFRRIGALAVVTLVYTFSLIGLHEVLNRQHPRWPLWNIMEYLTFWGAAALMVPVGFQIYDWLCGAKL
jgi:hypothetical protein